MEKQIRADGKIYLVTDEQDIDASQEIIFEIKNPDKKRTFYAVAMFDDLLGSPIQKVWKILKIV